MVSLQLHADLTIFPHLCVNMRICYEKVAVECLPKVSRRALRPWISNNTLQLISDRDAARAHGNHEVEKELTKSSKNAVKTDRTQWPNNILATGDCKEKIRKEIENKWPKQGRLKDGHDVVESISGQTC